MKSKRLTMKQEAFAQAYVKNKGNGVKAIEEAYGNKSKYSVRGVMATENLNNHKIAKRIEELKSSILDNPIALREKILRRLNTELENAKSSRDMVALSRVLLECAGYLGVKQGNVNITVNQRLGGPTASIEALGAMDLFQLRDAVNKRLLELNAHELEGNINQEWEKLESGGSKDEIEGKQTNDTLLRELEKKIEGDLDDKEAPRTGEDYLPKENKGNVPAAVIEGSAENKPEGQCYRDAEGNLNMEGNLNTEDQSRKENHKGKAFESVVDAEQIINKGEDNQAASGANTENDFPLKQPTTPTHL